MTCSNQSARGVCTNDYPHTTANVSIHTPLAKQRSHHNQQLSAGHNGKLPTKNNVIREAGENCQVNFPHDMRFERYMQEAGKLEAHSHINMCQHLRATVTTENLWRRRRFLGVDRL